MTRTFTRCLTFTTSHRIPDVTVREFADVDETVWMHDDVHEGSEIRHVGHHHPASPCQRKGARSRTHPPRTKMGAKFSRGSLPGFSSSHRMSRRVGIPTSLPVPIELDAFSRLGRLDEILHGAAQVLRDPLTRS
jgi:hypothetical protein